MHRPGDPRAGAVVCHPHPGHGGSPETRLVRLMAEALEARGVMALRFPFRSVGTGAWAEVGAALDALAEDLPPGLPMGVAGYSFGAWAAAHGAVGDRRVRALALVAPGPIGGVALPDGLPGLDVTVVAAEHDGVFPDAGRWAASVGATLVVVPGADHMFAGPHADASAAGAADALGRLANSPPARAETP